MHIYKFTVGNFAVNNFLIHPENSNQALLIDAGEEPEPILNTIHQKKLNLLYLINTHGHGDHIAGNGIILRETNAKLLIHEFDTPYLQDPNLNLSALLGVQLRSPEPDQLLTEGDIVRLDNLQFRVLHTPGHTPGHISLVCEKHAFVGDVIFEGSVGRTDLPLASTDQLMESIRRKIYTLPDDTILHPGHGPDTWVGTEKRHNPFVRI